MRGDFPGIARFRAYLNSAAVGLPPGPAIEEARRLLSEYALDPLSRERGAGSAAWEAARLLEALYGVPAGEVAWGESTTHMTGRLALSLAGPGGVVAVPSWEFPGVTYYIASRCRRLGCRVKAVTPGEGEPPEDALEAALDDGATVLVASSVSWVTGYRLDVPRLAARAARRGAWLVVDAIQHIGALAPGDLLEADAFCASSKKWLLAPHSGAAFCRVSPRAARAEPVEYSVPGAGVGDLMAFWADPAKDPASPPPPKPGPARFNAPSGPGYVQLALLAGVLRYLKAKTSPGEVERHILALRRAAEDVLEDAGFSVYRLPRGRESGIILVETGLTPAREVELARALAARGVSVTARGAAGVHGIRASIHLYNTEDDIHAFRDELVRALR